MGEAGLAPAVKLKSENLLKSVVKILKRDNFMP